MNTTTDSARPLGRWIACLFVVSIAILLSTGKATAQVLPGEIVFLMGSGTQGAAILKADALGNRSIVSQFGVRGSGPDFKTAIGGIAVGPDSQLYISGSPAVFETAVYRIDPKTGDRTLISGPSTGSGPQLSGEADIVVDPSGQIFVTSSLTDSLVQVDPATGNRTLISGPGLGSGPAMDHPFGLTRTPTGDFYSFIANDDRVFFIDAETGNRTIVSGAGVGGGTSFQHFGTDVTLLPDGDLASGDSRRILRIDPISGDRSELTSNAVGSGPEINPGSFEWLTVDSGGFLLATQPTQGIFRVNPTTGERVLLTGPGVGIGPSFSAYREAVEFVPVPEPPTLTLGVVAIVSAWLARRRAPGEA